MSLRSLIFIGSALFFCACHTAKKVAVHSTVKAPISDSLLQKGVDFYAKGDQPTAWELQLRFRDTVSFLAADGLQLKFAGNLLRTSSVTAGMEYVAQIGADKVIIKLLPGACNGEKLNAQTRAVTVTFKSKMYSGCGNFAADNSLGGSWRLEKIGNDFIAPGEYNKQPTINFDVRKGRVNGNDGCNAFGGEMIVEGTRIKFSGFISTKMACLKKNIQSIINNQLQGKFIDYYFRGGKLFLYLPDDSLLIFVRDAG